MNKEAVKSGVKLIIAAVSIFLSVKNAGKNGEKLSQSFIDLKENLKY